jgi:hypothetical protein
MKKTFFLIGIFSVFALISSCDKADVFNPNQQQSESIFKSSDEDDPTENLDLKISVSSSDSALISSNKSRGPIATLWRKKSNCRKLGICEWFPKNNDVIDSRTFEGREIVTPIIYNASTGVIEPIILEFTSSPVFLSQEDIKFYVDEDFEIEVTSEMDLPFRKVVIPEGIIEYNPEIGEYGGYILQIVGRN